MHQRKDSSYQGQGGQQGLGRQLIKPRPMLQLGHEGGVVVHSACACLIEHGGRVRVEGRRRARQERHGQEQGPESLPHSAAGAPAAADRGCSLCPRHLRSGRAASRSRRPLRLLESARLDQDRGMPQPQFSGPAYRNISADFRLHPWTRTRCPVTAASQEPIPERSNMEKPGRASRREMPLYRFHPAHPHATSCRDRL